MTRLGFLTYGMDRRPTGIGYYVLELLRALAELPGAPEIVLLTTEVEDRHGLWSRFEHVALPGCRLLPGLLTVGHAAVAMAARRLRLDLVHDANGIAPFLGPAVGAKRIVTIYDAFAYACPTLHNRLDNWRYRWMLPAAARRADAVLTASGHARGDLQRFLGLDASRIAVVYGGVHPRFRPLPDGPERRAVLERYGVAGPYVLYVGGINGRKNVAGLLEAFAQLPLTHAPATGSASTSVGAAPLRLVVAGKRQWATAELEAALDRLRLGDRVVFTGYVDEQDLPALYSAAELFAFPTLYEGFGFPPLEAMACGTPVVTSAVTSVPEVVGDAALLVEPTNISAIAGAMRAVLGGPELAAQLRRKGYARARQFTWQRAARQVVDVYEAVLADRSISVGAL